jgi:hypothetical protein
MKSIIPDLNRWMNEGIRILSEHKWIIIIQSSLDMECVRINSAIEPMKPMKELTKKVMLIKS